MLIIAVNPHITTTNFFNFTKLIIFVKLFKRKYFENVDNVVNDSLAITYGLSLVGRKRLRRDAGRSAFRAASVQPKFSHWFGGDDFSNNMAKTRLTKRKIENCNISAE
ncbi:MAG: hypothetical protein FWH27_03485 [Planctomycetaceae bacterium]|nr:hypothetical protein [Planctomycetaceae bacterium]